MSEILELYGIYTVEENKDVHLLEFVINIKEGPLDVGAFIRIQEGIDRMRWQSPWDEKYLDKSGCLVIGDWLHPPGTESCFRLIFYFHFLDFDKQLQTPYGPMDLILPVTMPNRLSEIIQYEDPN